MSNENIFIIHILPTQVAGFGPEIGVDLTTQEFLVEKDPDTFETERVLEIKTVQVGPLEVTVEQDAVEVDVEKCHCD